MTNREKFEAGMKWRNGNNPDAGNRYYACKDRCVMQVGLEDMPHIRNLVWYEIIDDETVRITAHPLIGYRQFCQAQDLKFADFIFDE